MQSSEQKPTGITLPTERTFKIGDIEVLDRSAVHLPANLVLFNYNGEEVVLGFGCRRFNDQQTADVSHFFHLSIPQFIKTHKMISDAFNTLTESGQLQIKIEDSLPDEETK
jgi:hypothetical protein